MIEINLIKTPSRSVFRPLATVCAVAAVAGGVLLYLKTGADSVPPVKREHSTVSGQKPPSTKKSAASAKKRLRATGFVRYGGSEFAMLVSGRKSLWVEKGQKAFGRTVSEIKEEGITVSRGGGAEFLPLK